MDPYPFHTDEQKPSAHRGELSDSRNRQGIMPGTEAAGGRGTMG